MKNIYELFLLVILSFSYIYGQECNLSTVFWTGGEVNCPDDPYKLVFSDDFNGNTLDTDKWFTFYPYGEGETDDCEFCRTHGDNESQIYLDENVTVSNGTLKLTAKKEQASWFSATREHTSGMIHSKLQFDRGRAEIRCKLPAGTGFWPAFWMFGGDELDVFENCGHNTTELNTTLHMDCEDGHFQVPKTHDVPNLSSDFHIIAAEWEVTHVDWFIDGQLLRRFHRFTTSNGMYIECGEEYAIGTFTEHKIVPDNVMNIIANLAISPVGSYCGDDGVNSNTPFPSVFEIDYIRYFQRDIQDGLVDLCAQIDIVGQDDICDDNVYSYILEGPVQATSWEVSSNLDILASTNNSIDIVMNGTSNETGGSIKAIFDVNDDYCNQTEVTKQIWLGKADVVSINGHGTSCDPRVVDAIALYLNQHDLYFDWTIVGGSILQGQGTSSILVDPVDGPNGFVTKLRVLNGCGWSDETSEFFPTSCERGDPKIVNVFPNPTTGIINVDIQPDFVVNNVMLVDYNTNSSFSINLVGSQIDLSGYNKGVYYLLLVNDNGESYVSNKIILK